MSNSTKGMQVYQMFKKHLEEIDFNFEAHDDDLVLTLTVNGDDLPQPTLIRVIDEQDIVQIVSPIPNRIPEDKRIDAAVAVSVANYGIINGSFDLDMSDGEIRFRVTQSFREMEMSEECIKYILNITFFTTDKYNDRFFMLGKGLMSLEQFIEKENEE